MKKRFHVCQSIAGLERLMAKGKDITWLTIDGRPATYEEIREAIEEAKAKGYEVLPPCDNVKSTGHCAGHDVPDDENNSKMSWGFGVPDEEVDLDRLIYEIEHIHAIKAKLYMHALWENAPHVYERLKEYCQKNGFLSWHNFDVTDWEKGRTVKE